MRVDRIGFFLLMIFLAACAKEDRRHLRGVSVEMGPALIPAGSSATRSAAEGQMLYTVTATLPEGLQLYKSWKLPVLVDNTGVRHRAITSTIDDNSNGTSVFAATFEVPENSQADVLEEGRYSIDFKRSLVTERKK